MMIMEMEKDWAHLGRNPETHVYTKCIKSNDDNENGKRLGSFCFNCVLHDAEVGGDLLFAAQITAST
jgi:hypothetical protein